MSRVLGACPNSESISANGGEKLRQLEFNGIARLCPTQRYNALLKKIRMKTVLKFVHLSADFFTEPLK